MRDLRLTVLEEGIQLERECVDIEILRDIHRSTSAISRSPRSYIDRLEAVACVAERLAERGMKPSGPVDIIRAELGSTSVPHTDSYRDNKPYKRTGVSVLVPVSHTSDFAHHNADNSIIRRFNYYPGDLLLILQEGEDHDAAKHSFAYKTLEKDKNIFPMRNLVVIEFPYVT